jgi:hypothetical protein
MAALKGSLVFELTMPGSPASLEHPHAPRPQSST